MHNLVPGLQSRVVKRSSKNDEVDSGAGSCLFTHLENSGASTFAWAVLNLFKVATHNVLYYCILYNATCQVQIISCLIIRTMQGRWLPEWEYF